MSVRARPQVVAFAVFVGAVVAITSAYLVKQRQDALDVGGQVAARHARTIESFVTQSLYTAEVIAASLDREASTRPDVDARFLRGLLEDAPFLRSLSEIGPDNRVAVSTTPGNLGLILPFDGFYPPSGSQNIPRIGLPWQGRDFATGRRASVGEGVPGNDLGFIPMLGGQARSGETKGTVIALNTDYFLTYIAESLAATEGSVDVIRYDNVLLLSSTAEKRPGTVVPTLADAFRLQDAEFGPLVDYTGTSEASVSYVHASPLYPFAVVVHMDRNQLLETWRRSAITLSGVVAVSLVLIGVLGAIYIRRQTQAAAQHRTLEHLQRVNAACVFANAREGIVITDADAIITDVNDAFIRITGYGRDEAIGENPRFLASGRHDAEFVKSLWADLIQKGFWQGEVWNKRKSGDIFVALQTISAVRDDQGQVHQYVSLFSDITLAKQHALDLEQAAYYDGLTTLANRTLISDHLNRAMAAAHRRDESLAVVFIDLDGFKAVNDTHGHGVGDHLLIALANRMKQILRKDDILGRIGGDEFVAVLQNVGSVEGCVELLHRLLDTVRMPIDVKGRTLQVSASLGVTFYPQNEAIDADQLLRQADQAMYQAKVAGKNRFHVFDAVRDRTTRDYHENLERIQAAMDAREFVLYFQPQVNMRSGQVRGVEALIRWNHPARGIVSPGEFLPMTEGHAIGVAIGKWVIETALVQLETWRAQGLDFAVSVNVGSLHLQEPDFFEALMAAFAHHPTVPHDRLEIEILESTALGDIAHTSQVIVACRAEGVRFALDDFGTGYSSLAYLKRLPVDILKIDQSFVQDMLDNAESMAILEAVLGLSKTFGYETIAEGVETMRHAHVLLELGCELAQGYCIARPMPADAVPGWIANWSAQHAHCMAETCTG
jgi:diguanylate cyclase (GGDEF)-like protein/PAS domain S-box-containing protein